ncbi:hypothetical protein [Streptomyces chartreusis]|uniref:hypothetical protein n=1 Tax=Streptomyces chartreusis TaxID=1969 RepID=UPI0038632136|nr:helix-turn-helix domain-containing protein [Streptomyces chartreusis]WTA33890.1 helix-turn-helix domain-containing protein [Streptomyces chartreusis]
MSYQGQTWVDEVAFPHLENTGELIMMLRVANHAGNGPKKMSGCFALSKTLAKECLMSPRAAQAHLRELSRRRLIISGDPKLVEHIRPDRRPPVYDLAGAHETGCPGGHDIDGECQPSDTGGNICHPSDQAQTRRSAGSRNDHPSGSEPATGSKKRQARVAKSATIKSSKELKDSRLSPDAPPPSAPPASAEGAEREAATQETTDVDKVLDAFIASYMRTAGLPPRPDAIKSVRTDAAALLSVGRSVGNLCLLAGELGAKGWTDLVKHAQMNPEQAIRPAGVPRPWCGECNDGREPASSAERMVETTTGMAKCHCHPGYIPTQPAHA